MIINPTLNHESVVYKTLPFEFVNKVAPVSRVATYEQVTNIQGVLGVGIVGNFV
jgi:hypothetical protein